MYYVEYLEKELCKKMQTPWQKKQNSEVANEKQGERKRVWQRKRKKKEEKQGKINKLYHVFKIEMQM
jgi:hypothetical protein